MISSEAFSGNISTSIIGSCTQIEMITKEWKRYLITCIIIFEKSKEAVYSLYKDDIQQYNTMSFKNGLKKNNAQIIFYTLSC